MLCLVSRRRPGFGFGNRIPERREDRTSYHVVTVNAAVLPSEKEIWMTDYASRDRSRSDGKSGQQDGGAGMEPGKRTLTESL